MNKVLLIGINARFSHPATALYYLREYVRDLPWDVLIREFTIHTPAAEIIRCIEEERPDAVAFSVYIWNTGIVRKILSALGRFRERPRIVLGGPDAGYNPEDWLTQFGFIDNIVQGHGEEAFRTLLACGFKSEKKFLKKNNPPFREIPFPYTDKDIDSFEHRKIYYETSRGCLFKCAYCLSSREDQRLGFREIDQIVKEIYLLMNHKPKMIKFVDRTFNSNKKHAHAVWKHIMDSYPGSGTRFHFEVHPDLIGEDDFNLLKNCPPGLFQFEIGIQSTCGAALKAVNRTGDWGNIKPKIKTLIGMNAIPIHVDLIAGLPFEDYDSLAFSFNEVYSLDADHFQLGYLKVLPGTEVIERREEWWLRYDPDTPYEVTENRWLSALQMKKIKKIAKLVDMIYNSHRFKMTLENLLTLRTSPFNLFEILADVAEKKSQPHSGMRWEYLAEILAGSAIASGIKPEYILDCLRWDWCASPSSNRFPKMLKTEHARKKRKKLISSLKEGRIIKQASGPNINYEYIMRSNFFFPETTEFREKYLGGKNLVLFARGKNEPVFLE